MTKKVRVRFAPSPTGGLHLGGVRTALFNYLYAKNNQGDFILRIEDTDQTRFVEGAEKYILECLEWCGIVPDESPLVGGPHAPYRQSERKPIYADYARQLVEKNLAYYAFDTSEELEIVRKNNPDFQYNHHWRTKMRNSISLPESEVLELLQNQTPVVIRIKMPSKETIAFDDLIRGRVSFDTDQVDDKVLLKADGMPTYHLAVVVDDYLMQISHAFRGEEWLPSSPVHILLWKYLFGLENMPQWAHMPLILKPDGNGKLSKRDSDRLGFPIFAMDWMDKNSGELTKGFKERGFLPAAFVNMLAMMGWNDGTGKELFSMEELIEQFSTERIHKAGAKFDYEKAKWFNHEWIKNANATTLSKDVEDILIESGIQVKEDLLLQVIDLVKDRCTFLTDFVAQAGYFFQRPSSIDLEAIQPKWDDNKKAFFTSLLSAFEQTELWKHDALENLFKETAVALSIKPNELMLPLRIMLVGGKFGPSVFLIAELIGRVETLARIKHTVDLLN